MVEHESDLLGREGIDRGVLLSMRGKPYQRQGFLKLLDFTSRRSPARVGVELGSYAGESLELMVKHGTFKEITCVDPWIGYAARAEPLFDDMKLKLEATRDVKINKIKAFSASSRVLEQFQEHSLDFVYIDAFHGYESVYNDIISWVPRVKPGQFIAGHDFSWRFQGVIRAVYETLGKPTRVFQDGSWCVKLNKRALKLFEQRVRG